MQEARSGSHTVYQLHVYIVWSTKYRFHVLKEEVQIRCRDLLRQTCDSLDVRMLKGVVSKDHVHLHLSYPPKLSISDLVKRMKGRSARILMEAFSDLRKRYWGGHFWGIGYRAWSSGNISDEMIQQYLEHHREGPNGDRILVWNSFAMHLQCSFSNGLVIHMQRSLDHPIQPMDFQSIVYLSTRY